MLRICCSLCFRIAKVTSFQNTGVHEQHKLTTGYTIQFKYVSSLHPRLLPTHNRDAALLYEYETLDFETNLVSLKIFSCFLKLKKYHINYHSLIFPLEPDMELTSFVLCINMNYTTIQTVVGSFTELGHEA